MARGGITRSGGTLCANRVGIKVEDCTRGRVCVLGSGGGRGGDERNKCSLVLLRNRMSY